MTNSQVARKSKARAATPAMSANKMMPRGRKIRGHGGPENHSLVAPNDTGHVADDTQGNRTRVAPIKKSRSKAGGHAATLMPSTVNCASHDQELPGQLHRGTQIKPARQQDQGAIGGVTPRSPSPPDLAPLIAAIGAQHRTNAFAIKAQMASDAQLGAFIRTYYLGFRIDMSIEERAALSKRSERIIAACNGKATHPDDVDAVAALKPVVMTAMLSRQPWDDIRANTEKEMTRLVKGLPCAAWQKGVCGFGEVSLARIIGEAGDIGTYETVSKLWKRLGLAVIGGERQRKKSGKENAAVHGYNPNRRAMMYVIGGTILRKQLSNPKDENGKPIGDTFATGPYGQLYLDRRAETATCNILGDYQEAAALAVASAKANGKKPIKENLEGRLTPIHLHNRAKRYMEKRLLRELWRAWRDGVVA